MERTDQAKRGQGASVSLIGGMFRTLLDLRVDIDVDEADSSRIYLNQKCRVSPEAYPDKDRAGSVAEIAPEANRQKRTLQIKGQIKNPDKFLTPEWSANVEFVQFKSKQEKY